MPPERVPIGGRIVADVELAGPISIHDVDLMVAVQKGHKGDPGADGLGGRGNQCLAHEDQVSPSGRHPELRGAALKSSGCRGLTLEGPRWWRLTLEQQPRPQGLAMERGALVPGAKTSDSRP